MNSIFLRIYGGIIAASIVIALIFYFSFQATNHFRLKHYRNALASGPVRLIAESVASRAPEERQQWVELLSRTFNNKIRLLSLSALNLDDKTRKKLLRHGLVMYADGEGKSHLLSLLSNQETQQVVSFESERLTPEHAKGTVMLVLDKLNRTPMAEWSPQLKRLNKQFSFPIDRVPPHQIRLNETQKVRLFNQREPLVLFENDKGGSSLLTALVLIPQTGELLRIGPQALFNWYPIGLLAGLLLLSAVLVGAAIYLLVKPLEQQLLGLERAVLRIRGGDLDARAPVNGAHAVAHLAGTVNGMADHIQRLIGAQKELTRAVSHELRTPVARIRFGLEMLADEPEETRRIRAMEDIDEDIEQLDRLIDEILTYSKLEEGTPVLDFNMIDIDALLQQIVRETNALGKGVTVDYQPAPNLNGQAHQAEGDERYIHRVVQNYVVNATRHANSRVRLSYALIGDVYRIDVEDDGPGISEEDRKRVFQPFTRLDNSRTRASGGYGLGLSIVARIAYWHGGKVKVAQSEALGGAQFSFMWPRLQSLREAG